MPRRIRLLLLLATLGVMSSLHTQTSLGCQYNVRETGFVDLGTERYFLLCYVRRDTPRDLAAAFELASENGLRDSGVASQVIDIDGPKDHPALKYFDRAQVAAWPHVVLVSPGEQSRVIPVKARGKSFRPALATALREVVDSPLRQMIVRHLARAYGIVLLLEGIDIEANTKAAKAAASAIATIERQMKFMPKPIRHGPVLVTLRQDSFSREAILLWSLGISEKTLGEPRMAVLYGRARWIGPLLKGDQITDKTVHNILSVVGADCECGIDPRLIRGTALPVKWDRDAQTTAAAELGFDPENPAVITEVSQIMKMRASLYPWSDSAPGKRKATVDDFPIPFVEDRVRPKSVAVASPVPVSVLYAVAAAGGVVLIAGIVMLVRHGRKRS